MKKMLVFFAILGCVKSMAMDLSSMPAPKKLKGSLEVICGSMFAGKSDELIRRLKRAVIAEQNVIAFKHSFDTQRCPDTAITSHGKNKYDAIPTDSVDFILEQGGMPAVEVVGIDEVQFFSVKIIDVLLRLVDGGKRVIVAGLDIDFRTEPFPVTRELLCRADETLKLRAICKRCHKPAYVSQRLVDGKPAKFDDPVVVIGAEEAYEPRCRDCFEIDKTGHDCAQTK